ncbi:MAG TPA: hypothetical protein VMF55_15805 [Solirubrobacterales bacterium]|nr:hypothetical protein [Solirubrobacterales bacterium]
MAETGYGSAEFLRACRVATACREIQGTGMRASLERLRGSAPLARYHRRLPVTELRLTDAPPGRMIAEHFAIRAGSHFRYRSAQGVLVLPGDYADYMRGRSRQALRTNLGHARRAGFAIHCYAVDNWVPGHGDARRDQISPGPIERWLVTDPTGHCVADAIVSVDSEAALLHGLVSSVTNARWFLHAAIVERLCGTCHVLLTNGENAYLLPPGHQHFQRLLGFEISRLRVSGSPAPAPAPPSDPAALQWPPDEPFTCGIAAPRPVDPVLAPA